MFILEGILRAESQEKVLMYLILKGKGYCISIAQLYKTPTSPIQKQLARLEEDVVVVSQPLGNLRNYQLNPRYPYIEPLKRLLKAASEGYLKKIESNL